MRNVLNATLALTPGRLTDSSLKAFLYEAAAIVNTRPLTTDSLNDPNGLEPLTPNHLVSMKTSTPLPSPGQFVKEDLYAQKRWRQVQYLLEQFWSRWKGEYLQNIMVRQRWQPQSQWKFGRILDTVKDTDGLVRKVKIGFEDCKRGQRVNKMSVVERPVHKLVLLLEDCER